MSKKRLFFGNATPNMTAATTISFFSLVRGWIEEWQASETFVIKWHASHVFKNINFKILKYQNIKFQNTKIIDINLAF